MSRQYTIINKSVPYFNKKNHCLLFLFFFFLSPFSFSLFPSFSFCFSLPHFSFFPGIIPSPPKIYTPRVPIIACLNCTCIKCRRVQGGGKLSGGDIRQSFSPDYSCFSGFLTFAAYFYPLNKLSFSLCPFSLKNQVSFKTKLFSIRSKTFF